MAGKTKRGPGRLSATTVKPTTTANDPFFTGTKERGRGALWSHGPDTVGSAILGKLIRTETVEFKKKKGENESGVALVFGPCVKRSADGEFTAHAQLSTLYSTTMHDRINPETDMGAVFAMQHQGYEESKNKGRSAFKLFAIAESTTAALNAQLADAGRSDLQVKASATRASKTK